MSVNQRQTLSVARPPTKRVASEFSECEGPLRCLLNRFYRRQHDSVRHTSRFVRGDSHSPSRASTVLGESLRPGACRVPSVPTRPLKAAREKELHALVLRRPNRLRFVEVSGDLRLGRSRAAAPTVRRNLFHPCKGGRFTTREPRKNAGWRLRLSH